jgi:uncharacterized protein
MMFHAASNATDIDCKKADMQRYEEIICEYPIINSQYEKLYKQQEDLINGGRIQQDTVESWKSKRNLCTDVTCMDSIFAEWKMIVTSTAGPTADQERDAKKTNFSSEQKSSSSAISADGVKKASSNNVQIENANPPSDASMAPSMEKTERVISENSTAETSSIKRSGDGGTIAGIFFIVLILLAVFKGKGTTQSKKTRTKLVKPKLETYIRGSQCCARCEYWNGNRNVEFGNTVTVDKGNLKGKCLVVHRHPRPSDSYSRCVKWKR